MNIITRSEANTILANAQCVIRSMIVTIEEGGDHVAYKSDNYNMIFQMCLEMKELRDLIVDRILLEDSPFIPHSFEEILAKVDFSES